MDSTEYLEDRLKNQISWYSKRSKTNQRIFKSLRISEIILSALIPFLSGITGSYVNFEKTGIIVIGILGVVIASIAGILSLGQFQEHWIEYRTTCESLKKEKYMFQTKTEPYDVENAFPLLVQRVETLISKENTNWAHYMMKRKKENGKIRSSK